MYIIHNIIILKQNRLQFEFSKVSVFLSIPVLILRNKIKIPEKLRYKVRSLQNVQIRSSLETSKTALKRTSSRHAREVA